jgi:hypothetical protein
MQNVGYILNSIIVANPVFFQNYGHAIENDSILYFVEVIDDYTIRIKDTQLKLTSEIINQLQQHFNIVD